MYNLFLDDERSPDDVTWIDIGPGPWFVARNIREFKHFILARGLPSKISFDNDLGDVECGEGRFCANWLIDNILDGVLDYKPFTFTVHSMNNVAATDITSKLNQFIEHMNK